MNWIQEYWYDFVNLFYPNRCKACGVDLQKGEEQLCIACRVDLPLSDYWKQKDNPIEQLFWGRVNIEFASSLMIFRKASPYRHLIHLLKYQGDEDVGIYLGEIFAKKIQKESLYAKIDYIIPVPLHPKKKKKRGYNQSDCIAKGLSKVLQVPYRTDLLIRTINTSTQTKKNKEERWTNVSGIFKLKSKEELQDKHILLVDDVITTGATIESCIVALQECVKVKISIASLARA